MRRAEDAEKGIMAVALDDGGDNILRFGRMKYDASLRLFRSDCSLNLRDYAVYQTKREAVAAAKSLRFPAHHVERVGSRFWVGWGIRHDARDHYFLATV